MKRWIWASLLLGASAAWAQLGEVSVSVGRSSLRNASLGTVEGTDERGAPMNIELDATTDVRVGFRFTVNAWTHLGHEFGYAYNHGKLRLQTTPRQEVGMPMHQGFYNFLAYATAEGAKVRPFVAGGGHFSTFYPPGTGVFSGNGVTKFGVNYGGGIKVRVSETLMLRLDVREYAQGKPDIYGQANLKGWLRQMETSMGVAFVF
jgi:opacity protein-like surface antigen